MRDYVTSGSTPFDETCAQVGQDDYHEQSMREGKAFIEQLRRQFGPEPDGARLIVKGFSHDFGTYREVVCYYEDSSEQACEYAFKLENECPGNWDMEAQAELGLVTS